MAFSYYLAHALLAMMFGQPMFQTCSFAQIWGGGKPIDGGRTWKGKRIFGDNKTWKLIQCLYGSMLATIVDMRHNSPSYLKWIQIPINDKNRTQVLVPAGCANGHLVMSEFGIFSYKQSEYYSGAENQFTVRWDDPSLNITWPIQNPILSERDKSAKFLEFKDTYHLFLPTHA